MLTADFATDAFLGLGAFVDSKNSSFEISPGSEKSTQEKTARRVQVFLTQKHPGLAVGVLVGIAMAVGPRHVFSNRHFHLFSCAVFPLEVTDASDLDCRRS